MRQKRVVLIDNHLPGIRSLVFKCYNNLPRQIRDRFTTEDLVHDCVSEARRKQPLYDPARSKFVTFLFVVVQRYLSKRIQYEKRACRNGVTVNIDAIPLQRSTLGNVTDGVDMDYSKAQFMRMYALLPKRLRQLVRKWFLVEIPVIRLANQVRVISILRRAMVTVGLEYEDVRRIINDPDAKQDLLRQANEFELMED